MSSNNEETVATTEEEQQSTEPKLKEIKTEEIEMKAERKIHPLEGKYLVAYGGLFTTSRELQKAALDFSVMLSEEDQAAFFEETLIYDEQRTKDFLKEIKTKDVVGVKNRMYKVVKKTKNGFMGVPREYNHAVRKVTYDGQPVKITLGNLDHALNIGYADILYRNDKPYGVDEELSYKVKVTIYEDEEGNTYVGKTVKNNKTAQNTTTQQTSE